MTPSKQFLLSFLLVVGVVVDQSVALSNLATFLNLMTSLKYDQSCSWNNEEVRQNFTRDLSSNVNRFSPSSLTRAMSRFSTDVVSNGKQFCSAPELLICSKDTEKCVCGDPGKEIALPNSDSSSDYVVERDGAGVNRCRWAEGTYCLSDDILKTQSFAAMVNSKCRSGTSCIAKADGGPCSFRSLVFHVIRSSGGRGRPNLQAMMRDMYQGKVCTCQLDQTVNEIDVIEFDDASNDIRRKKRSAVVDEQEGDELASSFVSPMLKVRSLLA